MKQKQSVTPVASQTVQSARQAHPYEGYLNYTPLAEPSGRLYAAMREAVPIIDAALDKIVRLTGGFRLICEEKSLQKPLDQFSASVRVGPCSRGLHQFSSVYLDSLLTYGNAVGEIVLDESGREISALYNARLEDVRIRTGKTPLDVEICSTSDGITLENDGVYLVHNSVTPASGQGCRYNENGVTYVWVAWK